MRVAADEQCARLASIRSAKAGGARSGELDYWTGCFVEGACALVAWSVPGVCPPGVFAAAPLFVPPPTDPFDDPVMPLSPPCVVPFPVTAPPAVPPFEPP
jgi:hypothetical protein